MTHWITDRGSFVGPSPPEGRGTKKSFRTHFGAFLPQNPKQELCPKKFTQFSAFTLSTVVKFMQKIIKNQCMDLLKKLSYCCNFTHKKIKGSMLNFASNIERIYSLLFPLRSSGNRRFFDDFRRNRSWLIYLNSFKIRNLSKYPYHPMLPAIWAMASLIQTPPEDVSLVTFSVVP